MATVKRGDGPTPHQAKVEVPTQDYDVDKYGVDVVCHAPGLDKKFGFPVTINLTRDEAILLCANISARLVGMAVGPPPK